MLNSYVTSAVVEIASYLVTYLFRMIIVTTLPTCQKQTDGIWVLRSTAHYNHPRTTTNSASLELNDDSPSASGFIVLLLLYRSLLPGIQPRY